MDNLLIALVIAAVAGLSNWLQHRAQNRQETLGPPKSPSPPRPPRRVHLPPADRPARESTLEGELRRLLGGETPVEPRTLPPPSPPNPLPRPHAGHGSMAMPPAAPTAALPQRAQPPVVRNVSSSAPLNQATANYQRAQNLQVSVSRQLRLVEEQTENALMTHSGKRGGVAAKRRARLWSEVARSRSALRQAFVASLIFGPPKSDEGSAGWS